MRQSLVEKFEKEFPPKEFGLTFAIGELKPDLLDSDDRSSG